MKSKMLIVVLAFGSMLLPVISVPPASAGPVAYSQVSSGGNYTCAVVSDGGVKCWGYGGDRTRGAPQLGNGTHQSFSVPVGAAITGVSQVAAGGNHTCALLSSGRVKCWGYNYDGQLGDGTRVNSRVPVFVSGLHDATQITVGNGSPGGDHTCAIVSAGAVECWGYDSSGQLGNGTKTDSPVPVSVEGITGASDVSAGANHTCAVISGTVKCWGWNVNGQLGNGTTKGSKVPVLVSGITDATEVSADYHHTCALLSGGTVKCWGFNDSGQLGDGTTTNSSVPVDVTGITNATQLSAGGDYTCAPLSSGSVKCWGLNDSGQLGNGTTTNSSVPVDVTGITSATQVSAEAHTCAVVSGGVKCWGWNANGELGNGTTTNSLVPVDVVAGPEDTYLSIGAPSEVSAGKRITITGVLSSPDASCIASQAVILRERSSNGGVRTTDGTGTVTFSIRVIRDTTVQMIYRGNASCGPGGSPALTINAT